MVWGGGARSVVEKHGRTVLELRAGSLSESDVFVERLTGHEALSTPFRFELAFRPAGPDALAPADLLGQEALLRLRRPDADERLVHGVLASLALTGFSAGKPSYAAQLVPRLALLEHTRNSRVFQNKTVLDIVKEVLDAHHVRWRLALSASYLTREFCVQYQESDLAFVSRLLEHEGIFYFFEHADDHETLVLADAGNACAAIVGDTSVPYRAPQMARDEQAAEHVTALERLHRERPDQATLRDFDFLRPDLDLTATADVAGQAGREVYEYPGGYSGPMVGKRLAKVRLEALRYGTDGFSGESTCLRLISGSTFDVSEHPDSDYSPSLLLVRIEHEAEQEVRAGSGTPSQSGYHNRFVAIAASAPYRPLRRTPRPRMVGAQTAIVVGPGGEEIHPDAYGRIKVQFHWDRKGKDDDHSSCFIRLAQAWAGSGFGQAILPRLGQEVVVRFLDGDPDRPLVVGAVYNGAHAPPVDLPAERTQALTRTDSSPGGGGFNEVRFDDTKGTEDFFRHAQKDQRLTVLNDRTERVGNDQTVVVGNERTEHVDGSQTLRVGADDRTEVVGSEVLVIQGHRATTVFGAASLTVGPSQVVTVGGAAMQVTGTIHDVAIRAASAVTVGGVHALNVAGAAEMVVDGNLNRTVADACTELVAGLRDEAVSKNAQGTTGGDFEEQVEGVVTLTGGKDVEESLGAKAEVAIDGPLGVVAKSIELEADTLSIVVDGKVLWQMTQSGTVTFAGSSVTVEADSDIVLKGTTVKKDASESAAQKSVQLKALEDLRKSRASLTLTAKASDGAPLANVRYKAELPDGTVREGTTDEAGGATIPAAKEGDVKLSFPDLDAGTWKSE